MDSNWLYEAFRKTAFKGDHDLQSGIMMQAEEKPIPEEERQAISQFVEDHRDDLVNGYNHNDRVGFTKLVEQIVKMDAEAQDKDESIQSDVEGKADSPKKRGRKPKAEN